MTDFFALLAQPRRAWLEPELLKAAFHEKSRRAHPDAGGSEVAFAQLNEAYQALQEPRRRLQHFLTLEGRPPNGAGRAVPAEIAELFSIVAEATQAAELAGQKINAAASPLGRSLGLAELAQARGKVDEALARLVALRETAEADLRAVPEDGDERWTRLEELYFRFAYLTRWIGQLEEKRSQLAALL